MLFFFISGSISGCSVCCCVVLNGLMYTFNSWFASTMFRWRFGISGKASTPTAAKKSLPSSMVVSVPADRC